MAIGDSSVSLLFRIRTSNETGKGFADVNKNIDGVTDAAQKGGAGFERFGNSIERVRVKISDLVAGNLLANFFQRVASVALDAGRSVLDYSAKLEQSKIGFETLMGSARAAQQHLADLQRFAADTPFEFQGMVEASQRLQGVGLNAQRVIPIMTDLGNALAAAGKGAPEIERASVALSQIISKGKLSAEEVNQLAENGIPAWKILSTELGIASGEVQKLAEKGEITSEVFLQAFQRFSKANFGDAMEKQSRTFSGAMSNIQDSLLIVGAQAFEPLFEQIRNLAVRFAADIQRQGNDFKNVGNIIAQYIGEGLGLGLNAVIASIGSYVGTRLKNIFTAGEIVDPITKNLFGGLARSIGEGLGLTDKQFVFSPFKEVTKDVEETNTELDRLKDKVKNTPSISEKLKADQAKKQIEDLNKIAVDLATKIGFFGDESEVAAAQQKLLGLGISDFNTGAAKSIISMAGMIDKLKEAKKNQEDYNETLKKHGETLDSFAENAFKNIFPERSELDKFNEWVNDTKADFGELKVEVAATRAFLQGVLEFKELIEGQKRFAELSDAVNATTQDVNLSVVKFSSLETALLSIAKAANLAESEFVELNKIGTTVQTFNLTEPTFVDKGRNFIKEYKARIEEFQAVTENFARQEKETGFSQVLNDAFIDAREKHEQNLEGIIEKFRDFLRTLKTVAKDASGNLKEIPLFTEDFQIDAFIAQILQLDTSINKTSLIRGVEKLNKIIEDLGLTIGAGKTNLEKFNETLSDPDITLAIEARAKALGLTTEELKRLLSEAARVKDLEKIFETLSDKPKDKSKADAPDDKPTGETPPPPSSGIFDAIFGSIRNGLFGEEGLANITSEAGVVKAVYEDLGNSLSGIFGGMISASQSVLENFILTGKFGADVFKKLAASIIASLAVEAGVKAVFQLAEGFVALANPFTAWKAPLHFTAAKIYGTVAGIALAAGLTIGALGGLGGGQAQSAFSSQTSQATGGGSSGQGSSGSGGEVYSSNKDKLVVDMSRNKAQSQPTEVKVVIMDKTSFGQFLKYEVSLNGETRDTIREAAK